MIYYPHRCKLKLLLSIAIITLSLSLLLSKVYATEGEEIETHQLGDSAKKEEGSFSKGGDTQRVPINLRSSHKALNSEDVKAMLQEYNFFPLI